MQVYLAFPGLYDKRRQDPTLTRGEFQEWWDMVFRPSVRKVLGAVGDSTRWASYIHNAPLAEGSRGALHVASSDLPASYHDDLVAELRRRTRGDNKFAGFIFVYEIRGTKDGTWVDENDGDIDMLRMHREMIVEDIIDIDRCSQAWVDVAWELKPDNPSHSLYWLASGTRYILAAILRLDVNDPELEKASAGCLMDHVGTLADLAGFRVRTEHLGDGNVLAFNVYSTDKQITTQSHFGRFRPLRGSDLQKDRFAATLQSVYTVMNAYHRAYQRGSLVQSAARLEIRWNLKSAEDDLVVFPTCPLSVDDIRSSLLQIEARYIW